MTPVPMIVRNYFLFLWQISDYFGVNIITSSLIRKFIIHFIDGDCAEEISAASVGAGINSSMNMTISRGAAAEGVPLSEQRISFRISSGDDEVGAHDTGDDSHGYFPCRNGAEAQNEAQGYPQPERYPARQGQGYPEKSYDEDRKVFEERNPYYLDSHGDSMQVQKTGLAASYTLPQGHASSQPTGWWLTNEQARGATARGGLNMPDNTAAAAAGDGDGAAKYHRVPAGTGSQYAHLERRSPSPISASSRYHTQEMSRTASPSFLSSSSRPQSSGPASGALSFSAAAAAAGVSESVPNSRRTGVASGRGGNDYGSQQGLRRVARQDAKWEEEHRGPQQQQQQQHRQQQQQQQRRSSRVPGIKPAGSRRDSQELRASTPQRGGLV